MIWKGEQALTVGSRHGHGRTPEVSQPPQKCLGDLQPLDAARAGMLLVLVPPLGSHLLKVEVPLPGDVQGWEEISDQPHEDGQVICHDLGDVEVS